MTKMINTHVNFFNIRKIKRYGFRQKSPEYLDMCKYNFLVVLAVKKDIRRKTKLAHNA